MLALRSGWDRSGPRDAPNCRRCTRLRAGVAIRSVFLFRASGRLTRSAASDWLVYSLLPEERLCSKLKPKGLQQTDSFEIRSDERQVKALGPVCMEVT